MKNDPIYTYLSAEQALALKTFIRHPSLTMEELPFVAFVSLSDTKLKELFVGYVKRGLGKAIEVVSTVADLTAIYREGRSDVLYLIDCLSFPPSLLTKSVYPMMLLYRDFIFERKLKHIYLGGEGFITSASQQMPDLFLINNVVLPLKNERQPVEKDIAAGKALLRTKPAPRTPNERIHLALWLDQRALNVGEVKEKESEAHNRPADDRLHTQIYADIHASSVYISTQEWEKAQEHLEKAQEAAGEIQNRSFLRAIRLQWAFLCLNRAEWEKAAGILRQFIRETGAGDSAEQLFSAYQALSYAFIRQNRLEEAGEALSYILEKSRQSGARNMQAPACLYLGDIYQYRMQYRSARKYYRQALTIYTSRESISQFAYCLLKLGYSFLSTDDRPWACSYFNQALLLYKSQRLNHGKASALYGLAQCACGLANTPEKTYGLLKEANELFLKERDLKSVAETERCLGTCLQADNRLPEAEDAYLNALETFWKFHPAYEKEEMSVYALLGSLYTDRQMFSQAETCLCKAKDYFTRINDVENLMKVYTGLGLFHLTRPSADAPDQALAYLQKALTLSIEHNSLSTQWTVRQALAQLYLRMGKREESVKQQSQAETIRQVLEQLNQQQP